MPGMPTINHAFIMIYCEAEGRVKHSFLLALSLFTAGPPPELRTWGGP